MTEAEEDDQMARWHASEGQDGGPTGWEDIEVGAEEALGGHAWTDAEGYRCVATKLHGGCVLEKKPDADRWTAVAASQPVALEMLRVVEQRDAFRAGIDRVLRWLSADAEAPRESEASLYGYLYGLIGQAAATERGRESHMTNSGAVRQRYGSAKAMVAALCSPRGSAGAREWLMSMPARPDDPDLVISVALADIPQLLNENAELRRDIERLLAEIPG